MPRKSHAKRSYSDDEKRAAVVLAMVKGPYRAAKELGIPRQTVEDWYKGDRQWRTRAYVESHRGQLADAFESLAWELLNEARDKMDDAPLNHLMTGAGIAVDKARIIRGQPTNINQNTNLNLPGKIDISRLSAEQRSQLLSLIQAARSESVPDAGPSDDPAGTTGLAGSRDTQPERAGEFPRVLQARVGEGTQPDATPVVGVVSRLHV